jgi:hypothetical protein
VKSVKNFRDVEKTSAECKEVSYLAILHLSRVELHCKLQEKLHRITWPLLYKSKSSLEAFECKMAVSRQNEMVSGQEDSRVSTHTISFSTNH